MSIPKAIAEGSFRLFGVTVRAYVLDDGQRILNAEDVAALLAAMANPTAAELDESEVRRYSEFMKGGKLR